MPHVVERGLCVGHFDRSTQELFLARDRFGARPLFLAEFGGDLSFASEIKALLRHPKADRELDPAGIVDAFTLWSIAPQRSAFRASASFRLGTFCGSGRPEPSSASGGGTSRFRERKSVRLGTATKSLQRNFCACSMMRPACAFALTSQSAPT